MAPHFVVKSLLIALSLSLISIEAHAISRYNSKSMSCASLQSKVRSEGAILLRWPSTRNPGLPLGDRFVRNSNYCAPHHWASTFNVPSADRKKCPLRNCRKLNTFEERYRIFRHRRR